MKSTGIAATGMATMAPRRFLPSALKSTPYYVLSGAAAIVFLFPLAWAAFASVNGTLISCATVVFTLAVSLLGGYAFAKFDFPFRNTIFMVTLAILMVPVATMLIPLLVLLKFLGLQNSLLGLSLVMSLSLIHI